MSYASVVAQNSVPLEGQPKPNPSLLESGDGSSTTVVGEKPFENATESTYNSTELGTKRSRENTLTADRRNNKGDPSAPSSAPSPKKQKSSPVSSSKDLRNSKDGKDRSFWMPSNLMAAINLVAIGSLGIWSFKNWNKPHWDRRVVGVAVLGIGTLLGSQGYLTSFFRQKKQLPESYSQAILERAMINYNHLQWLI